jgi:glycosyltransferase involved in cell wall biosynthesis
MRVLHLPQTALPWTPGGKQVYCLALARDLTAAGVENRIAIHQHPEEKEPVGFFRHEGISVSVLPLLPGHGSRRATFTRTYDPLPGFADLLDEFQPDLVHFHDQTGGASVSHLRAVAARGCRTVLSYHAAEQSCPQRELLREGRIPCDGEVRPRRCTLCRMTVNGVPRPLRELAALMEWPGIDPWSDSPLGRVLTARRVTRLFRDALREQIRLTDAVICLAEWCLEVWRRNGCPEDKLHLIRIGGPERYAGNLPVKFPARKPLRLVCSGRCVPHKGFQVLVDAVQLLPADFPVEVSFLWASRLEDHARELSRQIEGDARFLPPRSVRPKEVLSVLAEMDLAIVPSVWLEIGPLTVLDAFAAGLPVIGSRLGGIAELVRDGVDGLLFTPGNAPELASCIRGLVENPGRLGELTGNVRSLRTSGEVAADHLVLYRNLLAGSHSPAEAAHAPVS